MFQRISWRVLCSNLLLALASSVSGQGYDGYEQLPLPTELQVGRKITELRREKINVLRRGEFNATTQKALDAYYRQFLFRALTREDFADKVANLRSELLKDISRASGDLRRYLIKMAYQECARLLQRPKLHPVAHVNAVMILGELNQVEGDGTNAVPLPLVQVTKIAARLATQSSQPEPVRVAALTALERHARLRGLPNSRAPLSAEERQLIQALTLEIVQQKEVPEDRTPEAHEWVRELAVQVLQGVRDAGANQQVSEVLVAVLGDSTEGLRLRCAAAEALAAIDPASWETGNARLPYLTARLTIAVLTHELESLKSLVKDPYSGGPSRGERSRPLGIPETEGGKEDKEKLIDPRTEAARRRLLTRLNRLRLAVVGDSRLRRPGLDRAVEDSSWAIIKNTISTGIDHANELGTTLQDLGFQLLQLRNQLDQSFPDPKAEKKKDRERDRGRQRR